MGVTLASGASMIRNSREGTQHLPNRTALAGWAGANGLLRPELSTFRR